MKLSYKIIISAVILIIALLFSFPLLSSSIFKDSDFVRRYPVFNLQNINKEKTNNFDISTVKDKVRLGDLVLREGTATDSNVIMMLSSSDYSHIGIVTELLPEIIVTHATTDDDPEHADQVIKTPLYEFWNTKNADAGMLLRLNFINENNVKTVIDSVNSKLGQSFVLTYKGNSQERPMYCSILIYGALKDVNKDFSLKWQFVDIPLVRGDYLFPQAFIESKSSKVIYTFSKKESSR
ncbi:MAG: hypothetical protein SPL83_10895 [Succinivibrio sp.]|nr:hypothetical protein [Succinivibrio sp.]MDY6261324.1 hypothetical protein [Succinivibrio sp.]